MLPELSPAFGTSISKCCWIGGLDINRAPDESADAVVMIAVQSKIRVVRIGHEARLVRDIEFPGCLIASRRGTIACVADALAYSLLDVEHRQKIELFPICSTSEVEPDDNSADVSHRALSRSPPGSRSTSQSGDSHRQGRSGSAHGSVNESERPGSTNPDPLPTPNQGEEQHQRKSPPQPDDPKNDDHKPLPPVPKQNTTLKPHIVSPTPSEFLLVSGTTVTEPGVGVFVNTDGEMVPGSTMNFHRYPESIAIDGGEEDGRIHLQGETQGFVLAVINVEQNGEPIKYLEAQRWDVDPGEDEREKSWMKIPSTENMKKAPVGLRHTTSPSHLQFNEMGNLLRMVRLQTPSLPPHNAPPTEPSGPTSVSQAQPQGEPYESQESLENSGEKRTGPAERDWEAERNNEEARFARELGKVQSSLVMWSGNQIWRVPRNPLTIQLDDVIQAAQSTGPDGRITLRRDVIEDAIKQVQNMEPRSEAEFLGLNYVKQKASLLLFGNLLFMDPAERNEETIRTTEQALVVGEIDPRVILLLVPLLQKEVLQGPQGIWIQAGLVSTTLMCAQNREKQIQSSTDWAILDMVKRFLISWQQKRGYASITDESYLFDSVDAALLLLLLEQDCGSTGEKETSPHTRKELNELVDHWKGNFSGAVAILEKYNRLYVLSRLYQSRKMSRDVLKTWRRILDGEKDVGGEFTPPGAEAQMRRYLVRIRDTQLVEEYGSWLANRNPSLGVQVFADNESRVKLEPAETVALLKERAPNAVQVYLEHLVFANNVGGHFPFSCFPCIRLSLSPRVHFVLEWHSLTLLHSTSTPSMRMISLPTTWIL